MVIMDISRPKLLSQVHCHGKLQVDFPCREPSATEQFIMNAHSNISTTSITLESKLNCYTKHQRILTLHYRVISRASDQTDMHRLLQGWWKQSVHLIASSMQLYRTSIINCRV